MAALSVALPVVAPDRRLDAATLTIVAATLFNMVLCFLFTQGLPVGSAAMVAGCEIAVSAFALVLARDAISEKALVVMVLLVGYLLALSFIRQGSGPKIVRDLMLPFTYYFLGRSQGTPERVDRLVRLLLIIVFAVGVLECWDVTLYTRLFDVSGYFLAKGMIKASDADNSVTGTGLGLYISGMRLDGRNFLPFLEPILGLHRASSVFLEPIELSNFAVIAYAWLLCRYRACPALNTACYMALAFALTAMCDSRFASMVCVLITIAHLSGFSRRAYVVAALPLIMCSLTLVRSCMWRPVVVGDDLMGRLYLSGSLLASFTPAEWFGLKESLGQIGDAGYAYLVTYAGVIAPVALWAVFLGGSGTTRLARTVRGAIAIYTTVLLTVSYGLFSIKTAALLWYIYGTAAAAPLEDADV